MKSVTSTIAWAHEYFHLKPYCYWAEEIVFDEKFDQSLVKDFLKNITEGTQKTYRSVISRETFVNFFQ